MTVRSIGLIAALLAAITAAHAQAPPQSRPAEALPGTSQSGRRVVNAPDIQSVPDEAIAMPPDPPFGVGAWSLRVHTSGGFTGQGVGSVTISSDGQIACRPTCATPVSLASLSRVATVLTSILETAWIRRSPGFCSDCIRTTVTLKRREGDAVRMYVATWEDGQSLAPELRELRRLAFELRDARLAQR